MINLPSGSSQIRRTPSKIDPTRDRIVRGIDIDGFVALEIGLEDPFFRTGLIDDGGNPRPLECGKKAPARQVEPLDDQESQEEVGQIVKDVEAPRSDDVLPV